MKLRGLDGWCWVQGPKDREGEEDTNTYDEGDFVFFAREAYINEKEELTKSTFEESVAYKHAGKFV